MLIRRQIAGSGIELRAIHSREEPEHLAERRILEHEESDMVDA